MKRRWSSAELRELRKLYPSTPTIDIAAKLRRTLNTVYQTAARLSLKKSAEYLASPSACRLRRGDNVGAACRFQKGLVPWNKGTHWTAGGRSVETRFKPGQRSVRWPVEDYPVGALRINGDGQLDIKFREGGRAWMSMARFTWETERGTIPAGMVVRPINGDTHDTRIENLRLSSRVELMRENTVHRHGQEVFRAIQLRGALNRRINRLTREHAEHA